MQFDFSRFVSLNGSQMTFDEVIQAIFSYSHQDSPRGYRVIVGSDSEGYGDVRYASAIVVHRVGLGGRAFICKNTLFTNQSLRQKIFNETALSLALAQELVPRLTELMGEEFVRDNLIVHVDVGQFGETKEMIREVVGMVRGSGFQVETKPFSYAASTVADRFSAQPRRSERLQFQS